MITPFLVGNKIYLRPVELDDAKSFYIGENDPIIRESLFLALPIHHTKEEEKIKQYINSSEAIVLSIIEKSTESIIGQTAFFRIDYIHRIAVFYLAILAQKFWSKGYGTEVTHLMVDYAFQTLNLNRIQLHVCAENNSAIKIYQLAGFVKEGVLRQAMFRKGKYVDFWLMAMLRDEWIAKEK